MTPTRPSGVTNTDDGEGVIIAGYDQPVTMVVYNKTDLYRLRSVIQAAIERQENR
jgi:hypothetical protein